MTTIQHSADELGSTAALTVPPPPPPRPAEWGRALRALRELLANPQDTAKAFEIFAAFGGQDEERTFQRVLVHPTGQRLLAQRPSLIDHLADRAGLARMPADSFGRAYLEYLERNELDPVGLLALKSAMQAEALASGESHARLDPLREWFRDRTLLMHDLWHVLTEYDTDALGESALLPFSYAQHGGRANLLLVVGVAIRGLTQVGVSFPRYLFQAWRRGRRATWLPAFPYEELLAEPVEEVRRRAAIDPPHLAHPGGIRRGDLATTAGATAVS